MIPSYPAQEHFLRVNEKAEEVLKIKSWKCIRFVLNEMHLKLEFENPLEVSVNGKKDWLQINFIDVSRFDTKDGDSRLSKESTRLTQ